LSNLQNTTLPSGFTPPNDYRYIAKYTFGTSSTDPNEYRIFKDSNTNGTLGFIDNNFNAGAGSYELVSIAYEDPNSVVLDQLEITQVTSVTIQIEKTSGNFSGGQKAIVIVSKLPDDTQYSNNANTWSVNHRFEQLTQSDGVAAVNGTYIKNLIVDVNASPQFIDITFDVDYTGVASSFDNGDNYFIGVLIGDVTLPATTSDRKIVSCDVNTCTKSADVSGLITNLSMNFFSSEKRPGIGLKTSNIDTWDNRLHICTATFDLLKRVGSGIKNTSLDVSILSIEAQFVSRNSTTGESFVLPDASFSMPFDSVDVIVGDGLYQAVNASGLCGFDIKEDAFANAWSIESDIPGGFDATQEWAIIIPFVIPWRTVNYNPNVDTTFYNNAEPNNNLNNKTSNYSNISPWVTYFRLLVKVYDELSDTVTDYGLYSYDSIVRDFDVDPDTFNWTGSTKLYNESNMEVNYLCEDQDTRIETTFSMATAGGLLFTDLVGEFSIEEYNSAGQNCRLNSVVDWLYDENLLKPITGQSYVKVTQDVGLNTITLECLVDYTKINPTKSYTIMSHLQSTK
jgi:hypothetical protein